MSLDVQRNLYLVQTEQRDEHVEQCLAAQSPAAAGGGPEPVAFGALALTGHAVRYRPGTRWAPVKAAGKGWR